MTKINQNTVTTQQTGRTAYPAMKNQNGENLTMEDILRYTKNFSNQNQQGSNLGTGCNPENMLPFSDKSTTINSGDGDDTIIINGSVDGPVNIDSGSGDDTIIIGQNPQAKGHDKNSTQNQEAATNQVAPKENGAVDPASADKILPNKDTQLIAPNPLADTPDSEMAAAPNNTTNINAGSGDDTVIINNPGGQPAPAPDQPSEPEAPIAANENGRIWGDPHFIGGDGGQYDVQGEPGKTYDLLNDKGLEFNGRFDAYGEGLTVVGETGLRVSDQDGNTSNVNFKKDGTATINDEPMEQGKLYELADGGTAKLDGKTLTTTTAEGYTIKQDATNGYIDTDVSTGDNGVGNGQEPGGLLGQTFDADDAARNGAKGAGAQGEGAIDGVVQDYEKAGLFASQNDNKTPDTNTPSNNVTNINAGSGDDTVIINNPGGQPAPAPDQPSEPEAPIAANENGRIWGDPHFIGGDGGQYDVQGEPGKTYDLLNDKGLEFNGRFDAYGEGLTVVGETGLRVSDQDGNTSNVNFKKDGTATINDEPMEQGKLYELADGGTAKLDGKTLTTTTAEGYTIKQDATNGYIDTDVSTGDNGVGNGQEPGGLLGQTFDADNAARNGAKGAGAQGEGAIDGVVQDYEKAGLFASQNDNKAPDTSTPSNNVTNINAGSGDDTVTINNPPVNPPAPEPAPAAPVAANETGTIEGDPHFEGGDGGKYDIQGEPRKIYDLFNDTGVEMRGRFDSWGSDGATGVGETGITVGEGMNSDLIGFTKDGTASINNQPMEEGKEYELSDGATAKFENGELTVNTSEGYTIKQTAHGEGDRAYINASVTTGENGVDNGQMPGGLLGQTFDADNEARNGAQGAQAQGQGAIIGDVSDYERTGIDPINDKTSPQENQTPESDTGEESLDGFKNLLNEFRTNTGSGDDNVEITASGNHTVDLGSDDDRAYVNFEDGQGGNSAVINGGSGDDTVVLEGSPSDYTVSSQEDGYTLYTDQDGNNVRVADDVENIRFEENKSEDPAQV